MQGMRKNRLLQRVRAGQPAFGASTWSGSAALVELMGNYPFHWVNMDVEHTAYASYETVEHLCRAAELGGLTPMASIAEPDPLQITKLTEVGVMGFIVGHTITEQDAIRAVEAAKYPPAGRRGAAYMVRQMGYPIDGANWGEKADKMNQEMAIIGKIEDEEALANLDAILSTPIDSLFVGSFDLSHSISRNLGIPEARGNINHPKVMEARDLVYAKCKEHGKFGSGVLSQFQAAGGKTPSEAVKDGAARGVLAYYLANEITILGQWYSRMAEDLDLS